MVLAVQRIFNSGNGQAASESPFKDMAHLIMFMGISIVFTYFTNEGLKGQLHL